MGERNSFFKPALSPSQQVLAMASAYPGLFHANYDRNHTLTWSGRISPCALGNNYEVRIVYPHRRRPVVWVINPRVSHYEGGKKVPHTFANGSICLHLPEEWTPAMAIAATIVPWLSLWLYFYEVWQATGQWFGEGHEPDVKAGL